MFVDQRGLQSVYPGIGDALNSGTLLIGTVQSLLQMLWKNGGENMTYKKYNPVNVYKKTMEMIVIIV